MSDSNQNTHASTIQVAASIYIERGWQPVRLHPKTKRPIHKEWQNKRYTIADIAEEFCGDINLGVMTGEPSGGLADVDGDSVEFITLAPHYLPHTDAIFGRNGQLTHHLYIATPSDFQIIKFQDPAATDEVKSMLGELRGTGGQTMVDPSTHPDGSIVRWISAGEPCRLPFDELKKHVERCAAASLLARYWSPLGGRNHTGLAIAGALANAGWEEQQVVDFINPIALYRGDAKTAEVRATFKRIRAGKTATGQPTCAEIFGSKIWDQVAAWLHIQRASIVWSDPEPLPDDLPAVPPLPAELLPDALRPWLVDLSERAQVPLDLVAPRAMVALSAAVGRRIGIRPKRSDGWLVIPNLWSMIVAPPGYLKSPMLHEVTKPLVRFETEANVDFEKKLADYRIEKELAEAEKRRLLSDAAHGKVTLSPEDLRLRLQQLEIAEPIRRRYVVNDATVEKLGELLNENPCGLLLIRDEISGFLAMMDKAGHENDRSFYLECWNGFNSYTSDRISTGTYTIAAACLSILGGITPGPLATYQREAFSGDRDDGLLQRFQLSVYPDMPKEWRSVDRTPDYAAEAKALEVFRRFTNFDPDAHTVLRFDEEAQDFFDQWYRDLEMRLRNSPDEHPIMLAHLSKFRSLMPSLALLTHLCDADPPAPLSLETGYKGAAWCDYAEAHARRIYHTVAARTDITTRQLGEKLRARKLPSPFTPRDVYRPQWAGLSSPDDVMRALRVLEELGWIRPVESSTPGRGRPTLRFCINSKIWGPK